VGTPCYGNGCDRLGTALSRYSGGVAAEFITPAAGQAPNIIASQERSRCKRNAAWSQGAATPQYGDLHITGWLVVIAPAKVTSFYNSAELAAAAKYLEGLSSSSLDRGLATDVSTGTL